MATARPRYGKEEFARRGDMIYDREIRPFLKPKDVGKYVLIDIETGAYEIDSDELSASNRLLVRLPSAQPWLVRVGSRHARRIGPRPRSVSPDWLAEVSGSVTDEEAFREALEPGRAFRLKDRPSGMR